jgi:hypothetical protein
MTTAKLLYVVYSLFVLIAFQEASEHIFFLPSHSFSMNAFIWGLIGNGCWSLMSLIWNLESAAAGSKTAVSKITYVLFFVRPIGAGYTAVLINEIAAGIAPGISDILLKSFAILGGFTFVFWAKPSVLKRVYTKYVEKKVLDDEK